MGNEMPIGEGDPRAAEQRVRSSSALPATNNRPQIFARTSRFNRTGDPYGAAYNGADPAVVNDKASAYGDTLPVSSNFSIQRASTPAFNQPVEDPSGFSPNVIKRSLLAANPAPVPGSDQPSSRSTRFGDLVVRKSNFYEQPALDQAPLTSEKDPAIMVSAEPRKTTRTMSIFDNKPQSPTLQSQNPNVTSRIYLKEIKPEEVNQEYPMVEPLPAPIDNKTVEIVASNSKIPWMNPQASNRNVMADSYAPLEPDSHLVAERTPANIKNYRSYSPLHSSQLSKETFIPTMKTERYQARQALSPNYVQSMTNQSRDLINHSDIGGALVKSVTPDAMTVSSVTANTLDRAVNADSLISENPFSRPGGLIKEKPRIGYGRVDVPGKYVYEGELLDGKFEGNGKLTYPDGSTFLGQFRLGARNGYGRTFKATGELESEGYYGDDELLK